MHETGSSKRRDWPLAVVVGAGGMGMAIARRLGQSHRLLLADRNGDHLARQVAQLEADGYDAAAAVCDVTRDEDISRLATDARERGPVKALANVVGLSPSLGDFRSIIAVNLIGAAAVARALAEVMEPGGGAVFITSSAGHMGVGKAECLDMLDDPAAADLLSRLEALLGEEASPGQAYALSKKALIRLCQREAAAWGRKGLRIVSLSPGLIATPQGALEFKNNPAKYRLLEATPLSREGTMLEIANVVEFLLSDRASYISGTDILVDGGLIAALGCHPFA
jgi:NAD(P)-dependent dehydrogenase (short-subunit alcohol dehydrogenase family)